MSAQRGCCGRRTGNSLDAVNYWADFCAGASPAQDRKCAASGQALAAGACVSRSCDRAGRQPAPHWLSSVGADRQVFHAHATRSTRLLGDITSLPASSCEQGSLAWDRQKVYMCSHVAFVRMSTTLDSCHGHRLCRAAAALPATRSAGLGLVAPARRIL